MKNSIKYLMAMSWVGGLLLAGSPTAHALGIDPWRTELTATPGETLTGTIELTNERNSQTHYTIEFKDKSINAGTHQEWIELEKTEVSLGPFESTSVAYTIHMPADANGELYGRLSFSESEENDEPSMMSITTRISIPIFVIVRGTESYAASILRFRIKPHRPLQAEILLRNSGNVHVRAQGTCTLVNTKNGKVVATFPVNPQAFPVYPRSERALIGNLAKPLDPGSYRAELEIPFPDETHILKNDFPVEIAP